MIYINEFCDKKIVYIKKSVIQYLSLAILKLGLPYNFVCTESKPLSQKQSIV